MRIYLLHKVRFYNIQSLLGYHIEAIRAGVKIGDASRLSLRMLVLLRVDYCLPEKVMLSLPQSNKVKIVFHDQSPQNNAVLL